MKIKFSEKILNLNREIPKGLNVETRRNSQTEFPIDAREAKIFDRGNAKTTIVFSIERCHKSETEALFFATTHAGELSNLSPAKLIFTNDDTKEYVQLKNASPLKIKIETDGMLSTTRYEFSAETPEKLL